MDIAMDAFVVNGHYTVCARRSVAACRGETSGIDNKRGTDFMADRNMGVTVNDAMGLGKHGIHPVLDIVSRTSCAMTEAEQIPLYSEESGFGQGLSGNVTAHVATDRMYFLALKSIEDGHFCQVPGVNDHIAIVECSMNILLEVFVYF